MKQLLRNSWVQQLFFWAFSFFVLFRLFTRGSDVVELDVLFTILFHIPLVIVVYANAWLVRRYLIQQRLITLYLLFVIVLLGVGVLVHFLTYDYIADLIFLDYFFASYFSVWEVIEFVGSYIIVSTLLLLSQNGIRLKEQQLALEKENNQVKLSSLKSQLNPHFLFNSLNNIYGSTSPDNKKGRNYILQLSEALRYMIYDTTAEKVALEKEVDYLKNYVALEKIRFESASQIHFTIHGELDGIKIAPLLLLPLVENCFKHCNREQPSIDIQLSLNDQELRLITKNNLSDLENGDVGGVGLSNLKNRLALIYPQRHQFDESRTNTLYESSLRIQF